MKPASSLVAHEPTSAMSQRVVRVSMNWRQLRRAEAEKRSSHFRPSSVGCALYLGPRVQRQKAGRCWGFAPLKPGRSRHR